MADSIDWSLAKVPDFVGNALAYQRAGVEDRQKQALQAARTTAGNALSRGDYTGASSALYGAGDVAAGYDVQKAGNAQNDDLIKATADAASHLGDVYEQTKDPQKVMSAFDAIAPQLRRYGATPEAMATARDYFAKDPQGAALALGTRAATKLGAQVKVVGDEALVFDKDGNLISRYRGAKTMNLTQGANVYEIPGTGGAAAAAGGATDTAAAPAPAAASIGGQTPADALAAATGPAPPAAPDPNAPRNQRNFNPGNIEDGPFARSLPGYVGSDGRFAIFDSDHSGANAQMQLLGSYGKRGLNTVASIVNRWAPPSDNNDTAGYVKYVSDKIGVGANQPLDMKDAATLSDLSMAMRQYEGGSSSASNQPPASPNLQLASGPGAPSAGSPQSAPTANAAQAARQASAGNPDSPRLLVSVPKTATWSSDGNGNLINANGDRKPDPTIADSAGLSDEAKQQLAESYLADGQLPAISRGKAGMKDLEDILNLAAGMRTASGKTGADAAVAKAGFRSAAQALTKATNTAQAIESFEGTARLNGQIVRDRLNAGAGPSSPLFNMPIQAVRRQLGSADVTALDTAIKTYVGEAAKINSGNTGAGGATDTAQREMANLLNPNSSVKQILASMDVLDADMANRTKSLNTQKDKLRASLYSGGVQTPDAPGAQAGSTPAGGAKPPQGTRQGQNGKFYFQDPNKPGSFPEIRPTGNGKWAFKSADGSFYGVTP